MKWWLEFVAKKAHEAKAMEKLALSLLPPGFLQHPADTFDQLTAKGYKLDLVKGEYLPPSPIRKASPRKRIKR